MGYWVYWVVTSPRIRKKEVKKGKPLEKIACSAQKEVGNGRPTSTTTTRQQLRIRDTRFANRGAQWVTSQFAGHSPIYQVFFSFGFRSFLSFFFTTFLPSWKLKRSVQFLLVVRRGGINPMDKKYLFLLAIMSSINFLLQISNIFLTLVTATKKWKKGFHWYY